LGKEWAKNGQRMDKEWTKNEQSNYKLIYLLLFSLSSFIFLLICIFIHRSVLNSILATDIYFFVNIIYKWPSQ